MTLSLRAYDLDMADALSQQELEAVHCWEADDRVPGRPEMTAFRRQLRYHQSRWRESKGHPIGSQPIDRAETRRRSTSGREPPIARLRSGNRRELPHRSGTRGGEGQNFHHRASPELRSPAVLGRPPVVAGAGLQSLRRRPARHLGSEAARPVGGIRRTSPPYPLLQFTSTPWRGGDPGLLGSDAEQHERQIAPTGWLHY